MRIVCLGALLAGLCYGQIVQDVRKLATAGDFTGAQAKLDSARGAGPWTSELILAQSWIARGAQAKGDWERALSTALETRQLALTMLKTRPLDADKDLPLALGASIEVQGHALANTGRLAEAVAFLKDELKRWKATSMHARIQKNLHLLTLEGKPAPKIEAKKFVGPERMKSLADFKGKPVFLFLWAHWCGDCKAQGPILESMRKEFPNIVFIAPTQRYGYVAGGEEAPHEVETPYIAKVQQERYAWMSDMVMPVSEENFRLYGVSTTPTLVLIDAEGIVRLYHPGKMTADELRQVFAKWVK
jgi:thiol-disulfide isomerase/thioredoxin